jgi:hypothetical protein
MRILFILILTFSFHSVAQKESSSEKPFVFLWNVPVQKGFKFRDFKFEGNDLRLEPQTEPKNFLKISSPDIDAKTRKDGFNVSGNFKHGHLNGLVKIVGNGDSSVVYEEGELVEGKRVGKWISRNQDGSIYKEEHYAKDELSGLQKYFNPNGAVKSSIFFSDNGSSHFNLNEKTGFIKDGMCRTSFDDSLGVFKYWMEDLSLSCNNGHCTAQVQSSEEPVNIMEELKNQIVPDILKKQIFDVSKIELSAICSWIRKDIASKIEQQLKNSLKDFYCAIVEDEKALAKNINSTTGTKALRQLFKNWEKIQVYNPKRLDDEFLETFKQYKITGKCDAISSQLKKLNSSEIQKFVRDLTDTGIGAKHSSGSNQ